MAAVKKPLDDEICECPCRHREMFGPDRNEDCTDDYCGFCGKEIPSS